ncbi:MAG: phage regulatory CII family protein [Candidatus Marinimicrobia bacterium]|nr:phage regulatory CII family protein [Candidatus Neomarinimicrobiota bacterium]
MKQIAPELDRAVSTFYAYCRGEQDFPIELLGELVKVTKDPQFIEVFLQDTDYVLNRIPKAKDIRDHTSAILINMKMLGDLAALYEQSMAGGLIDQRNKKELKTRTRELITELSGFMESI